MKTDLWYAIHSDGAGAAYIRFYESRKLAEWVEEHQYEGWGDSCVSFISVESDGPVTFLESVETAESVYQDYVYMYHGNCVEEFEEEFGIEPDNQSG